MTEVYVALLFLVFAIDVGLELAQDEAAKP